MKWFFMLMLLSVSMIATAESVQKQISEEEQGVECQGKHCSPIKGP